ncbi:CHAP domain-containing protein [Rhodobacter sp. Har01]|uniref:CHAP domain-containing protein n=1 Tax=Rhodobacter sp. Har01 TaxID=2883999 RepID=UPI001D084553|nr:CHAP domain-containing protein [Rhodobacter sp. Har01]MCB6179654.1 CHAP domain-containing protein [Rhodobacter sp. Har01]
MTRNRAASLRLPFVGILLALLGACSAPATRNEPPPPLEVHVSTKQAVVEAQTKRARGERVWCVPFARTASGIAIRGNAETWWASAKGLFARGNDPAIGSVMVFSGTSKLPMGHVAVVSSVVSEREIHIDHANWKRNQVSLGMSVIDVSQAGDWSAVKVESNPGAYGRVYPISGFIYPQSVAAPPAASAAPTVVVSTSGTN